MTKKPTYEELERSVKQLESEVLDCVRNNKECIEERDLLRCRQSRRTISLMKINAELEKEIKEPTPASEEEPEQIAQRLRARIKELNCLYDISRFGTSTNFSLDDILQAVIDFIPPAFQNPEITCARIIFDGYEFTTKNFKDTRWKLAREITVNNVQIGTLEVCYLEEVPAIDEGPFSKEAKNLIGAIAENIANIIEREWAEDEIKKYRNHVEKFAENRNRNSTGKK